MSLSVNASDLLRESMRKKPASNRGARQKTSTPKGYTRMNYNENAYGMSDKVKQALIDSALDNFMYQDFYAVDFKDKIAALYGLNRDYVLVGSGSSAIIDMVGEVFINYGDEVVYCMPSYEAFPDMVSDNGGVRVEVPLDKDYRFDLDAMLAAVTERTKMVVVVNPNNPTGTRVHSADVEAFVRKLPPHVVAVVDEAYFEYVDDPTHYSMIRMIQEGYDKPLIVLRTFSKIYGLAGMRVGYAISQPEMIDELNKACQAWNVGRAAMTAAEAAMDDMEYVAEMKKRNVKNRGYVAERLKELGCEVAEPAANFIFFDPHVDAATVKEKLADDYRILVGAPNGHIRVTVGTEEQNDAFLEALEKIIAELKAE